MLEFASHSINLKYERHVCALWARYVEWLWIARRVFSALFLLSMIISRKHFGFQISSELVIKVNIYKWNSEHLICM